MKKNNNTKDTVMYSILVIQFLLICISLYFSIINHNQLADYKIKNTNSVVELNDRINTLENN